MWNFGVISNFGMWGRNQGSAPLPRGWGEGFGVFHRGFWECSQIPSQFLYLIQEEVQVLAGDSRIGDNLPEEVDVGSLGLVSHHHGAPPDHLFLDGWGHLGGSTISRRTLFLFLGDFLGIWKAVGGGGNLEFRVHLSQFLPEFRGVLLAPQAGWDEPEAEVDKFWLQKEEEEREHGHSPNSQNLIGSHTSRNSAMCI